MNQKTEFLYDERGFWSKIVYRDGQDRLYQVSEFFFDERDNMTMQLDFDAAATLLWKIVWTHDGRGRILTEKTAFLDGSAKKTTFEYDEQGNTEEWAIFDKAGNLKTHGTYRLDNEGRTTESSSGAVRTSERVEYDSQGNWTKRVMPDGLVETRVITYYE
jgi:YD repeat-containing protein